MLKDNPTLLLVDDESLLREVASMMLEDEGATVLVAPDGEAALKVFAEHREGIDGLVLDFSMPKMNGFELFEATVAAGKTLPVVFVSGLPVTPEVEALCRTGRAQFLPKPFLQKDLVDAVSRALAKPSK